MARIFTVCWRRPSQTQLDEDNLKVELQLGNSSPIIPEAFSPKWSPLMGMDNFSASQQKIIKRYYNNIDTIQLQKLAETVTDLYLAEGKKVERLWKTAVTAMQKLEVPQQRIDILVQSQNLEQLAKLVKELQG
jgi:hypothetical protein